MLKFFVPLILTASVSATLYADESHTVNLQFNWPDSLEGSVEYSYETIKRRGEEESIITLSGSSDIRATKTDNGYQMDSFNHVIDKIGDDGSMTDFNRTLMEKMSSVSTTTIISSEGIVQSVTGMESMTDDMRNEIMALTADMSEELKASVQLMVDDALSDKKLFEQAQTSWDSSVGQWIGAELESGYIYEIEYGTPISLLDNQEIPTIGFYEYLGPVKCSEDADTKACAELQFSSELNADVTAQVLDLIYERWNIPRPDGIRLAIEFELSVVTDPTTLVPYRTREVTRIYNPDPESGKQSVHIKSQTGNYTYTNL